MDTARPVDGKQPCKCVLTEVNRLTCLLPPLVGFSCAFGLHFNIPAAPLRLGFRSSSPVSVLAGLVLSPHAQTWAATSCATHVAV